MKNSILFTVIFIIFMAKLPLEAQYSEERNMKVFLGTSNAGTEFYLTFHPGPEDEIRENQIKIIASSVYYTKVSVHIPAIDYYEEKSTTPFQTVEFTLTPAQATMYSKGNVNSTTPPDTARVWQGRAIIVRSDDPIVCYGVARYGDKSGGFMALPTHVLGQQYQVATFPDPSNNTTQFLPSYTSIVGVHDNTKVTFRLGGNQNTRALTLGNGMMEPGEVARYTLNKGDVWLIATSGTNSDLTGSTVSATKPLAVFSGNFCAGNSEDILNCDYTIEQHTPQNSWGKDYIVTPIADRKNYPIVRIFTSEPDALIRIDGLELARIPNSGGIINKGYLDVRTGQTQNPAPVRISSDYPINTIQYNPGKLDDGVESSPFLMQVVPVEQFSDNCIFAAVGNGEFGFETNYFNLVYLATEDGQIPEDLTFTNHHQGIFWSSANQHAEPGSPVYGAEKDGRQYYSTRISFDKPGLYRMEGKDPFTIYQYGNDSKSSFGTMAVSKIKDLTKIADSVAPLITTEEYFYGSYEAAVVDLAQEGVEPSRLASVMMIAALSNNFDFYPHYLTPGLSLETSFELRVIDLWKPANAVIATSDRIGNYSLKEIKFTPKVIMSINADDMDLGMIKSGQYRDFEFMLANDREANTVPIDKLLLQNDDSQFEIIENIPENTVLGPMEEHPFIIRFHAHDLYSDDIENLEQVFTNGVDISFNEINAKLSFKNEIKIEVANPHIFVVDVDFEGVAIGYPVERHLQIFNRGKMPLLITKFIFPEDTPFNFDFPEVSEESPLEILPNDQLLIRGEFFTTEPGFYSAILKVESDGYILRDSAIVTGEAIPLSVDDNNSSYSDFAIIATENSISFQSENDEIISDLKIFNSNGRLIFESNIINNINAYSAKLPLLSPGVYLTHLKINDVWVSKKFIIAN